MIKTKCFRCYYFLLGVIVLSQIVITLYQGGLMLYERTKISQLKQEVQTLEKTLAEVEQATHQKYSLNSLVTSQDLSQYAEIDQPLIVTKTQALALTQTGSF
ncbi:MAG: hypothetical protein ABIJ33_04585 [Patescibacteria group bacterium]